MLRSLSAATASASGGLRAAAVRAPRRHMGGGGHGHAAPEYTGVEAAVRKYLPENYHLVYGVLGGYAAIVTIMQIRGGFQKSAKIAAQPAPVAPDYHTPIPAPSGIPDFGTPEWEAFIAADPKNFEVWMTG